jgi:hypothetical protein
MPIYRAQIAFPRDSALPRDEMQITPHYNGTDAQLLANSLKANLIANANIGTNPFKIKIYDAKAAPPAYPLATAEQTGSPPGGTSPREIALCLSYYAQFNRPHLRGRLYLHPSWLGGGTIPLRPSDSIMTAAVAWKQVLGAGLPPSTFWCVYSRKTGGDAQVTNVWVDDEWDIMRSRGLRSTKRTLGTLP